MNLSPVKSQLEKMSCTEHGSHPTIVVNSGGLSVTDCCCENFKAKIGQRAKELISEQAKDEIANTLNKAFKR